MLDIPKQNASPEKQIENTTVSFANPFKSIEKEYFEKRKLNPEGARDIAIRQFQELEVVFTSAYRNTTPGRELTRNPDFIKTTN